MSDKLGPLAYGSQDGEVFLGHSVTTHKNISEETAREIDLEVRRIVEAGYQRAHKILSENREQLERIAQGLLEFETLSGKEVRALMDGESLSREDGTVEESPVRRSSVPKAGPTDGGATGVNPDPQQGA